MRQRVNNRPRGSSPETRTVIVCVYYVNASINNLKPDAELTNRPPPYAEFSTLSRARKMALFIFTTGGGRREKKRIYKKS